MTFYRCSRCGNIVAYIHDSGVRVRCCGEEMQPIELNAAETAGGNNVPAVRVDGITVNGSHNSIALWLPLMIASGMGLIGLATARFKAKNRTGRRKDHGP